MQRRLRWAQVDEREHPASPETPADPAAGQVTAITGAGRERRADGVREALTSRGAGWAVAAAMAGAVVGLSVAMATSPSPTVVVQPEGLGGFPAGPGGSPAGAGGSLAGAVRASVPGGAVQAQAPVRLRLQAPARMRALAGAPLQAPARLRLQVPAGAPLQAPARLRLQVPVRLPVQSPARLRAGAPTGALIPVPRAVPGAQATAATPRSVRLHLRPAQLRIRVRIPASARAQVLPRGLPGPLGVVVPGPRPAEVFPARAVTPARLRVVFQHGLPIPAQLVLPANLPGQARMRIQIPARARLTPIVPAPPAA